MRNFKKILAAVLSAAMVVTLAPAGVATNVQAAAKATKGTSTLKVSATKATIKVGKTKTIKVTVNKKQKAALKVTLKSSKASVAKVASKTTIKKGAKTATFKITAKKAGKANITVSYKTSANKTVKKTIKVTVNNSETNDDNVVVTDGKITVTDDFGFQTDGSALIGDRLRVNIPVELGTMSDIVWYCDGQAMTTTTTQQIGVTALAGRAGEYYAVAITSKGTTYKSNTVKVVATEGKATITSFTLEDVLDAEDPVAPATYIDYDPKDDHAVATVVLKKAYDGTFGIFKESDSKLVQRVDTVGTAYTENGAGAWATGFSFEDVQKNNKQTVIVAGAAGNRGYAYRDFKTGETTYKFTVQGLTRGEKYVVAFDQADIADDSFGKGKENKFETAAEAPYLPEIDAVKLQSVSDGSAPKLAIYGKDDAALTWIASDGAKGIAGVGLASVKFFSNTVKDTKTGTELVNGTTKTNVCSVKDGVITSGETAGTAAFWYATIKTKKGIYGKDAVEKTSEIKDVAQATAEEMNLTQDATTASSAVVAFKNLRADGTVYVFANDQNGATSLANAAAAFDKTNSATYTNSAAVKKGDAKVVITDVIANLADVPTRTDYAAIFIPDDETNYGQVATTIKTAGAQENTNSKVGDKVKKGSVTIVSAPVKFAWKATAGDADKTISSGANSASNTGMVLQDQFGNVVTTGVGTLPATLIGRGTNSLPGSTMTDLQLNISNATGVVTLVLGAGTAGPTDVSKGEYDFVVGNGQTIHITFEEGATFKQNDVSHNASTAGTILTGYGLKIEIK